MKIKPKSIYQVLLAIMFLAGAETVSAQHDHSSHDQGSRETLGHQPPNGGELKEIGKYKIEMVSNLLFKEDQLTFYIYKGNLKSIYNEDAFNHTIVLQTLSTFI